MREVAQLVNHALDVVTEPPQHRADLGELAEALASDAEPDSQRRQTLLNAVVKVLGNTLPLRIPRRQHLARRTPSPSRHEEPDAKAAAFAICIGAADATTLRAVGWPGYRGKPVRRPR